MADGYITPYEMEFFYKEQLHRMDCLAQEVLFFSLSNMFYHKQLHCTERENCQAQEVPFFFLPTG
jgi:hypothetical protein